MTGEPLILIGIDRYSKGPVLRVCKSTEAREVIKSRESFNNLYGLPENIKSDKGSATLSKNY